MVSRPVTRRPARRSGRLSLDPPPDLVALLGSQVDVQAIVVVRAYLGVELLKQGRGALPALNHEVQEEQAGDDAVALRQVAAHGVAAALLAGYQGVHLHHLRAEELEAHRRLVDRHAVQLAQALHHVCRGDRLDDRPAQASHLQEVVGEEAEDLELGQEASLFVEDAQAVGVAVGGQADVGRLAAARPPTAHSRLRAMGSGEACRGRPGCARRSARVPRCVRRRECLPGSRAGAVHGVHPHPQPCGAHPFQVHQLGRRWAR